MSKVLKIIIILLIVVVVGFFMFSPSEDTIGSESPPLNSEESLGNVAEEEFVNLQTADDDFNEIDSALEFLSG
jgi:uncharacterized protein YxeA